MLQNPIKKLHLYIDIDRDLRDNKSSKMGIVYFFGFKQAKIEGHIYKYAQKKAFFSVSKKMLKKLKKIITAKKIIV